MSRRIFSFITGAFVIFSSVTAIFTFDMTVHAAWGIFGGDDTEIHLCTDGSCTLEGGVEAVSNNVPSLETKKSATQFIIDIVLYILTFVTLVAVVYIMYAGFQVLIGGADEKKFEVVKKTVVNVIIGIVVMWLAYAIVTLIISALENTSTAGIFSEKAYAAEINYTESDIGTFAEYQKKLTAQAEIIQSEWIEKNTVSSASFDTLQSLTDEAFRRLPDSANYKSSNESAKRELDLNITLSRKNPGNQATISRLTAAIQTFVTKSKIDRITGQMAANPASGNAPLTVSLSASNFIDPSGVQLDPESYVWWVRESDGRVTNRKEIGRGANIAATFTQDQTYTVFLDVISKSKNTKGYTDVLPFSQSVQVNVQPRIGTVTLFLNGINVSDIPTFKITPAVGAAGIIFDATASRGTAGTVIQKTNWKFGNGTNDLSYNGAPLIERQIYANKGKYEMSLELVNNQGKSFRKDLTLIVQDSNATISANKTEGFVGENFNFTATSYFGNINNVIYQWTLSDENGNKIYTSDGLSMSYAFPTVGTYVVSLTAQTPNGASDTDSKTIVIGSRNPYVNFDVKNSDPEHPNRISLNAGDSYDADTQRSEGLTYNWRIDNADVTLMNSRNNGAIGEYEFRSIGEHSVTLTITNRYGKVSSLTKTVIITSLLSIDLTINPMIGIIGERFQFTAHAPVGQVFEWNFGDGTPTSRDTKNIADHIYDVAGKYTVVLTVYSSDFTVSNQVKRTIFVGDTSAPLAAIQVKMNGVIVQDMSANCNGNEAYIVDRANTISFDGGQSINTDGTRSGLSYTWKYQNRIDTTSVITRKFDEIGCFPISLTVKNTDGTTSSASTYISVQNLPPTLTSITTTQEQNVKDTQKILVSATANGAKDTDGVIVSYIWYYYTEGGTELQDVRVTQSPKTTFVLPNVSEKYYFGVILEDNDGARTNSDDSMREKVPLIITNENGNVNIPLITLTPSSSRINVDETVTFRVNARNILGRDITNESTYAWDFNGDGIMDQKGSSPVVDYTYPTQGRYQMKVKVTFNGVTNTKYQTIAVDNVLSPAVTLYRMGTKIYAINSSQGHYTSSKWVIGEYSVENTEYALYDFGDESLIPEVGTLFISDGVAYAETSFTIADAVTYIPSSTGISYLTYPPANGDTIIVQRPDQKVLLALWMNRGNRFSIDTDTAVDTNLDGVTNNDEDNRGTDSYNNGSPFSVYNGDGSNTRKRSIKITIFESGNPIGEKVLTLFFPFVSEYTGSGNSNTGVTMQQSGKMSNFEKDNLSTLDGLIRTAPEGTQEVLRKNYNLLLENWDDINERTKIILEMEETITKSGMTDAEKSRAIQALRDIMAGEVQSQSLIESALKTIEGLVAKSTQSGAIMEKLNQIRSHPLSTEENKVLGSAILEIVKTDPSINDKYKLILKDQLSFIINGSIPTPAPTNNTNSTSSTGILSTLLGFLMGFLQILFWIIVLLGGAVGIGFLVYQFTNKHPEISFQDFIIDRIFHKTPPAPPIKKDTTVTPPEVPAKQFNTSTSAPSSTPLTSSDDTKKIIESTPPPSSTVSEESEKNGAIPNWLQEYGETMKQEGNKTMEPQENTIGSGDPLTSALTDTQGQTGKTDVPLVVPSVKEVEATGDSGLPAWLTSMDQESLDAEVAETLQGTPSTAGKRESENTLMDGQVEQSLGGTPPMTQGESIVPGNSDTQTQVSGESASPDTIRETEMVSHENEASHLGEKKEKVSTEIEKESITPVASSSITDTQDATDELPDWLRSAATEKKGTPPPIKEADISTQGIVEPLGNGETKTPAIIEESEALFPKKKSRKRVNNKRIEKKTTESERKKTKVSKAKTREKVPPKKKNIPDWMQ